MSKTQSFQREATKGTNNLFSLTARAKQQILLFAVVAAVAAVGGLLGSAIASSPIFLQDTPPRAGNAARTAPPTRSAALPSEVVPPAPPAAKPEAPWIEPEEAVLPPPKVKGVFPRGLHPVIKHSMVEASRYLPEGWQLEFMNALRDAPGVWNGPHGKRDQTGGALAVDVWLVNPNGERLCNFQCSKNFEAYRVFMQMVKHIQDRDYPTYKKQGRWGGYFGGGYANDEMHYDLEPSDWTAAGNWKTGLLPGYAHFGKKQDVLQGMGDLASYRLPGAGTAVAAMPAPEPKLVVADATPVVMAKPAVKTPPVAQKARPARVARVYRVRYEEDD